MKTNGGIVLEDFNKGDGFYKIHLDYLNKKQVEEIEELVKGWNEEDEKNFNEAISYIKDTDLRNWLITLKDRAHLHQEQSDEQRKVLVTPEILKKNGFVANKHVFPYPYFEYKNKEDELKIGFAFPQGNKTSYTEPWVYIDSRCVFVEHLPCRFVYQLRQILHLSGIEKEIIL